MAKRSVPESNAGMERKAPRLCDHVLLEVLGVSRAATYLRCRCGALLVAQDGNMWPFGTAF